MENMRPEWITRMEHPIVWVGEPDKAFYRLISMALDAWDMAYNAGTEGVISPAQFCEKYQDRPSIPYVAIDNHNDGSPV